MHFGASFRFSLSPLDASLVGAAPRDSMAWTLCQGFREKVEKTWTLWLESHLTRDKTVSDNDLCSTLGP